MNRFDIKREKINIIEALIFSSNYNNSFSFCIMIEVHKKNAYYSTTDIFQINIKIRV